MMTHVDFMRTMYEIEAITGESYLPIQHAIIKHGGAVGAEHLTPRTTVTDKMTEIARRYALNGRTTEQIVMMLEAFADGWVNAVEQRRAEDLEIMRSIPNQR